MIGMIQSSRMAMVELDANNLTVQQTNERVEEFGRNVFFKVTNPEHINYQHISYGLEGCATPQIAYPLLITTEDHVLFHDFFLSSWVRAS